MSSRGTEYQTLHFILTHFPFSLRGVGTCQYIPSSAGPSSAAYSQDNVLRCAALIITGYHGGRVGNWFTHSFTQHAWWLIVISISKQAAAARLLHSTRLVMLNAQSHWLVCRASPFLSGVANESGFTWSMGCEAKRSFVSLPSRHQRMTTSANP